MLPSGYKIEMVKKGSTEMIKVGCLILVELRLGLMLHSIEERRHSEVEGGAGKVVR